MREAVFTVIFALLSCEIHSAVVKENVLDVEGLLVKGFQVQLGDLLVDGFGFHSLLQAQNVLYALNFIRDIFFVTFSLVGGFKLRKLVFKLVDSTIQSELVQLLLVSLSEIRFVFPQFATNLRKGHVIVVLAVLGPQALLRVFSYLFNNATYFPLV